MRGLFPVRTLISPQPHLEHLLPACAIKYSLTRPFKSPLEFAPEAPSFQDLINDFKSLGGNHEYLMQEIEDRVSDRWLNPGNAYSKRPEVWIEFLRKDGRMSGYTYNSRLRDQIPIIVEELKRNPNTRQAIMTVWNKQQDLDNLGGIARVPCSLSYQFLVRRGVLDVIYVMRSCDVYTHLIYDIALTMGLNSYIAGAIGREPGRFIHMIGSLHAYKKDYAKKGIF